MDRKTIILLFNTLWLFLSLDAAASFINKSFNYDVYFLGIKAGEQVFHITDWDKNYLCLTLQIYSSPSISKFYKLNDYIEVYIHKKSLLPHRVKKIIQEGKFRRLIDISFDYGKNVAYLTERNLFGGEKICKNITVTLKKNTFETVSMIYYLMNQNKFSLNNKYKIYLIQRKEDLREVDIKVLGKTSIRTKLGTFNAWCLSSEAAIVWLSEDQKIPLKMKYKTKLGYLTAILKDISL